MVAIALPEAPIQVALCDGANIYRTYIRVLGDRRPRKGEDFDYAAFASYCDKDLGIPAAARLYVYKHKPDELQLVPLYRRIVASGWQWIGAADCCVETNDQADDGFIIRVLTELGRIAQSGRSVSVAVAGMDGAYARPLRRLLECGKNTRVTLLCFKEHLAASCLSLSQFGQVEFVDFQTIGVIPATVSRPFLNPVTEPEEYISRLIDSARLDTEPGSSIVAVSTYGMPA